MYVVAMQRPSIVVELGTYYGDSYCAFCQAVKETGLDARCYAVDTWTGDPQAGLYGPEVLADLRAFHDSIYGGFSTLLQSTFDDALSKFSSGSIDLLHIDGCHFYRSVRHDFESWLPKMSPSGVVLLHDTNERREEYGVWQLWEEVSRSYPHFEFLHGHGLGLLAVGPAPKPEVQELCLTSGDATSFVRALFARLGQALPLEVELLREREKADELRVEIETLRGAMASSKSLRMGRWLGSVIRRPR